MIPIPILINVRDFGSPAAAMVRYLRQIPDARPIIVDNASTWAPWLAWLESAPCEVVRLRENRGPRAPLTVLDDVVGDSDVYVITDGDLDLAGVPLDCLDLLRDGLDRYPKIGKVGLSLRIDDIPAGYPFRDTVRAIESKYWWCPRDEQFFNAAIDTTFCMLRTDEPYTAYEPALRADKPYTARHVPWYMTRENVTPEYLSYLQTFGRLGGFWTSLAADQKVFA